MAQIDLHNLSKTFRRGRAALRSTCLEVRDGELLALVGPSGSGKSTLLRLIAGLERPSSGDIRIGGETVNSLAPHRRGIAMVFQNSTLYQHMTVQRNLEFGLRGGRASRPDLRARLRTAAEVLRIDDLLDRYPAELSGGERQRAALAKAMVRRPRAFLFDEPLSSLDVHMRHEARTQIKSLHRRLGTTTIHVTHDQEEAMALGDRIAVLHMGALQQVGTPQQIYDSPENAFVAAFIGSPRMNFVPGAVRMVGDGLAFIEADYTGTVDHGNDIDDAAESKDVVAQELLRFDIPAALRPLLEAVAASTLVAGFRPQALRLASEDAAETLKIDGLVSLVEPLGDWINLVCRLPSGREIVARQLSRDRVQIGQRVRLSLMHTDLFFFEPGECGRNLLLT